MYGEFQEQSNVDLTALSIIKLLCLSVSLNFHHGMMHVHTMSCRKLIIRLKTFLAVNGVGIDPSVVFVSENHPVSVWWYAGYMFSVHATRQQVYCCSITFGCTCT